MYIEQGEEFSLSIEADDNILPLLDVQVEQGALILRTEPDVTQLQFETIIYRMTLPELSMIDLSGSADIHVEEFDADSLNININGSGDVTFVNLDKELADKMAITRLPENATRSSSRPKRRKTSPKPANFLLLLDF